MKPWYWPVTTTVYKMFLTFFLVIGTYTFLDFIFQHNLLGKQAAAGTAVLVAVFYYFSLKYKDWL